MISRRIKTTEYVQWSSSMQFEYTPKVQDHIARLKAFFDEHIYPNEKAVTELIYSREGKARCNSHPAHKTPGSPMPSTSTPVTANQPGSHVIALATTSSSAAIHSARVGCARGRGNFHACRDTVRCEPGAGRK